MRTRNRHAHRRPRRPVLAAGAVVMVAAAVLAAGAYVAAGGGRTATSIRPAAAAGGAGGAGGAGAGDVATAPVDAAGKTINLHQSAAQAAASGDCTLTVPANPLTAAGLATPYQLGDGCTETNANLQAFVEATILAPNGRLQVYNPLVTTQGVAPAAKPVPPVIPGGSRVIIDIGFNGNALALQGAGATQGNCVDALGQSLISQVSACNAASFYAMANREIGAGVLTVPPLGTGKDGQTCLDTRNFGLIDQDQSDNVVSAYLINGNGQTAQDTAANAAAMGGSQIITNGSDDALLSQFVDPSLGCTPFTAPDSTFAFGNSRSASQALNELSARQNQRGTIALVPVNDPMTLVGGKFSVQKTNVYRALVDQPALPAGTNVNQNAATYCQDMVNIQPARSKLDQALEAGFMTPVPALGTNLATFLGARLSASFTNLNCANFGLKNPVSLTVNGNGAATAVAYNTAQQRATVPANLTPAPESPIPGRM